MCIRDRVYFQPYRGIALRLGRKDETAANIAVFDKAGDIGQMAGVGVSFRRFQSAVRHPAYHVGIHGIFLRQLDSHIKPRLVYAQPVNDGIGSCKVYVLKNAQPFIFTGKNLLACVCTISLDYDHISRLHVPDKLKSRTVQGTAFGRHRHAVLASPQT